VRGLLHGGRATPGAGRCRGALLAIALAAAVVAPAPAGATVLTGVSDQGVAFFDSPAYRALDLNTVRLIVPWDAGLRRGPWDAWIQRALADGATVMIALEHASDSRCPDSPCALPSRHDYGDALDALLVRYPAIAEVTAWNEPNHSSQPTFQNPAAAAGYYDEARARCPACTVVAGDFLDDVALSGYLSAYRAALTSTPAVWGLHNYYDATYFQSRGVETMLRETSGRLWLTETGGIVSFSPPGGGGLPYDEQRAADGVTWLYDLAARQPAIERMYLYQWQGTPDNGFDSGVLGYDGTPRPSYAVVAAHVGPRPGAGGALAGGAGGGGAAAGGPSGTGPRQPSAKLAAPGARGTLRPGRALRLLAGGRLEVRARCVTSAPGTARCRQRLIVRVAGVRVARLAVDVASRRMFTKVIHLARWATRRLARGRPRSVQLQSCAWSGSPCAARTKVAVTKPLAHRQTTASRTRRCPAPARRIARRRA
jgi:hypothetical protein